MLGTGCEGSRSQVRVLAQGLRGHREFIHSEDLLIVHNEELNKLSLVSGVQQTCRRAGTGGLRSIWWPQQCRPKYNSQVVGRHLVFFKPSSHPEDGVELETSVVNREGLCASLETWPGHSKVVSGH